ncbi:MAG: PTS glucose/sucrose transporter subunit IIB [Collinsella sp.]
MAEKYDDLARSILENVGGADNVASVAHCITRALQAQGRVRANTAKIEALKGVIQVIQANGRYQVVVGNIVEDVYDAVLEAGNFSGGAAPTTSPRARRP